MKKRIWKKRIVATAWSKHYWTEIYSTTTANIERQCMFAIISKNNQELMQSSGDAACKTFN